MLRFWKWHQGRSIIIQWRISKKLCRLRQHYLPNAAEFPLLFKKYRSVFIYIVIIIIQFLLLIKMRFDYNALYSLANSSFPDTFWHEYYEIPKVTVRRASNVSLADDFVIVTACGRDVAAYLPLFRKNLYSILELFKGYRIFLGESDSLDSTLMNFRQWQNEDSNVHVHTYGNLIETYSENRAHRIAFCRNDLLRAVRQNDWISKAKFLLVMDIDINANPILTVDNFLTNFEYDTRDWAVMTASQTKFYYDIWAVRSHTLNYDCWEVVDPLKHREIAQKKYISVHTKPIPREFGLVPVRSAFGGFGVYQTAYLNNCYYEAFDNKIKQKCEHVSFNECVMRNGGKIFINSKFQNADGPAI
jgi:hypothetical protein